MSYPQYPMQPQYQPQYQPQVPNQLQQKRKLDFVDGEAGMRSFYVNPGEVVALFDMGSPMLWLKSANDAGVPSVVRYRLTEEGQSIAGCGTESRLAAMEQSINEIKEVLNAHTVPDVRAGGQPRHVSGAASQAGSGTGWQPGGGSSVADEVEPAVRPAGGQSLS